jgi:hypothetical protein
MASKKMVGHKNQHMMPAGRRGGRALATATDHSVVAGAVGSFSAGSLVPLDQLFHGPAVGSSVHHRPAEHAWYEDGETMTMTYPVVARS